MKPLFLSTRNRRKRVPIPRPPVLSSDDSPWQGIFLAEFGSGPIEVLNEAPLQHHVLVQLDHDTRFEWGNNGHLETVEIKPGQVSLFPAFKPFTARNPQTYAFLLVALEPKALLCSTQGMVETNHLDFTPRYGVDDPLVRGAALALREEIAAGYPGGRWYGETLAEMLSAHLVRHYASQSPVLRANDGGLAPNQLKRALEFIHTNLAVDTSLQTVAAEVGLSTFHFARQFKRATGIAPHQYLIQQRIQRAKELLVHSLASVAEVAQQVGFCDQSHFARHFRRTFGMTPKTFRQRSGQRKIMLEAA